MSEVKKNLPGALALELFRQAVDAMNTDERAELVSNLLALGTMNELVERDLPVAWCLATAIAYKQLIDVELERRGLVKPSAGELQKHLARFSPPPSDRRN